MQATTTEYTEKEALMQALNDLYIAKRHTYISADYKKQKWFTVIYDENKPKSYVNRKLWDGMVLEHLEGKAHYGVVIQPYTKFMTFDFDFDGDWALCKFVHGELTAFLNKIGVPYNCQYTFFSGSKGVHLTLYFTKLIPFKMLQAFYNYVMREAGLNLYKTGSNKVEFRPSVKMPLGYHHKTRNKCVMLNTLNIDEQLPDSEILNVNKIVTGVFLDEIATKVITANAKHEEEIHQRSATEFVTKLNAVKSYAYGDEYYESTLANGLVDFGMRHNTTRSLAMYLNGKGYTLEETHATLKNWLEQFEHTYSTPLEEALIDLDSIVEWVYVKNATLSSKEFVLNTTTEELETMLTAEMANGRPFTAKRKLLLFALLVHGKRFKGKFYMTYAQMTEATGIKDRKSLKQAIDEFEKAGLVTVHRRNARVKGRLKSLPNVYEVMFMAKENTATSVEEVAPSNTTDNGTAYTFTGCTPNTLGTLVQQAFTAKEIRKLVPRDQVKEFIA